MLARNRETPPAPTAHPRDNSREESVSVNLCSACHNKILWQNQHNHEMKNNLPTLTVLACLVASVQAQEPTSRDLLQQAAQHLRDGQPLDAVISQQIKLFNQELTGSGKYLQLGGGSGKTRLNLTIAAGGEVFTRFEQLCDGNRCYLTRETGDSKQTSYIDIKRVRRAIEESNQTPSPTASLNWMVFGGLPHLLEQLVHNFDFDPPKSDFLGEALTPVWVLRGKWKPAVLAQLLPAQKEQIMAGNRVDFAKLPKQMPHEIEVTLVNDEKFPLFPHRIVYLQQARSANDAETDPTAHPVVVYKLFDVQLRPDFGPTQFEPRRETKPGADVDLINETGAYLKRLGLKKSQ